ncbi:hypothetical protein ACE1SV_29470 [Streptomyces sennicomposti]
METTYRVSSWQRIRGALSRPMADALAGKAVVGGRVVGDAVDGPAPLPWASRWKAWEETPEPACTSVSAVDVLQ